jgi:Ser/Thr protein kinase RdoA (MazF antagonist)
MSEKYSRLKKSTIHADSNYNNIIVTDDIGDHKLVGLIDYGLAIHS